VLYRPVTDKPDSVIDGGSIRTSTESLPAVKMLSLAGSTVLPPVCDTEPLDRSVSQPNICGEGSLSVIVPASPTVLASCSSTSSDLSRGGYASADSLGSLSSKDDIIAPSPVAETETKLTADLVVKNMEGGKLNVEEDTRDRCPSLSTSLEPTPDLVLNLPTANSTSVMVRPLSPPLTTAEVFARAEHGTIKKNTGIDRTSNPNVDPITNALDEVFPSTPHEINDALDMGSFSFELLPPPPPRLLDIEIFEAQLPSLVPVEFITGETILSKSADEDQLTPLNDVAIEDVELNHQTMDGSIVDECSQVASNDVIQLKGDSVDLVSYGTVQQVVSPVVTDSEVVLFVTDDIVPDRTPADSDTCSQVALASHSLETEVECLSVLMQDPASVPIEVVDTLHGQTKVEMSGKDADETVDQISVRRTDESVDAPLDRSAGRFPDSSADIAIDLTVEITRSHLSESIIIPRSPVNDSHVQRVSDMALVTNGQHIADTAISSIEDLSFTHLKHVLDVTVPNVSGNAQFAADSSSALATVSVLTEPSTPDQEARSVQVPSASQSIHDDALTSDQDAPSFKDQSLPKSVLAEPLTSHRAAPSLHAHSAVLELLTKQHGANEELAKQSPFDKSKNKPPPVMKKPAKHHTHDVTRHQ